jgi:ABC-type nitrate/sulfonate/bicarbonate transport system substrate-binding protein
MKKLISILTLTVILLTGCSTNDETIDIVLDYTPNTNHVGVYVADQMGYYEEVGLDVNIVQATEVTAETLVATNKAEFGFSYQENVLMAQNNEMDVQSVYAVFEHNSSGFISHTDKNITSPKDFENKTYCGWGSDIETAIIKQMAINANIDPDSITIKNVSTNFINTPSEECDFFWIYDGWTNTMADLNNIEYNFIPMIDYGIDFYSPVIITNSKTDPEDIEKFISATNKGYMYAMNNPEHAANIMVEAEPELDYELVYQSLTTISPNFNTTGYQDPEIWANFSTWLKENNIINQELNENNAYTNEYIQGAE